jgi:DTW domain-containing protein YfiP
VLYLGSAELPPPGGTALAFVDRKGKLRPAPPAPGEIQGLVVLDGTWSQAKSLWWRNAWLLKLQRAVLRPPRASLYGRLRREPRRESVSTLEAAALALAVLEGDEGLPARLIAPFVALLEAYRRRPRRS